MIPQCGLGIHAILCYHLNLSNTSHLRNSNSTKLREGLILKLPNTFFLFLKFKRGLFKLCIHYLDLTNQKSNNLSGQLKFNIMKFKYEIKCKIKNYIWIIIGWIGTMNAQGHSTPNQCLTLLYSCSWIDKSLQSHSKCNKKYFQKGRGKSSKITFKCNGQVSTHSCLYSV